MIRRHLWQSAAPPLWILVVLALSLNAEPTQAQANRLVASQAAPHGGYWPCFALYNDGAFRDALSEFRNAASTGMNIGGTPWIDSICYHAMMGECYFQMGDLPEALEQYTAALKVYLINSNWMLRIDVASAEVTPEQNMKTAVTWGKSARASILGHFPGTFSMLMGRLDNQNVLRTGGVIDPPQIHPVHVAEIIRCTCLALSQPSRANGACVRVRSAHGSAAGSPFPPSRSKQSLDAILD